jgi:hypothetical protein
VRFNRWLSLVFTLSLFVPTLALAEKTATGGKHEIPITSVESNSGLKLDFAGYLRPRFSMIQDEPKETSFVGRYDGFQLSNARVGVEGSYGEWGFKLAFDGALDRRYGYNTSEGEIAVGLKDAYIRYAPCQWGEVLIGQFKPAFGADEFTATRNLMFVDRALPGRGVHGVEGFNVDGTNVIREVGLQLRGSTAKPGDDGFALVYYFSLTNGSGANKPLNDNSRFAYYGRIEAHYGERLTIGGAGFFNQTTSGAPPDDVNDDMIGYVGDIRFDIANVLLAAEYTEVITSVPDVPAEPEGKSRGYFASIAYRAPGGLVPGYRFAYYDPTAKLSTEDPNLSAVVEIDELTHHTVGLTWFSDKIPLKVQVNYTLAIENEARAIANNRLDAVMVLGF